jgi:flagellar motor protein MotB
MARLKEFLVEDSNQYGPGTDLMVSLMAVFLVITFSNGFLYRQAAADAGNDHFKLAHNSFNAGDFKPKPFREFIDERSAMERISAIAHEYESLKAHYPYIFVIGHASELDVPNPADPSPPARWDRNWNFAGERAAMVSRFLQQQLKPEDRDKLVVVSTGEFDKRDLDPKSQANAWVQVVFGSEWKPRFNQSTQSPENHHYSIPRVPVVILSQPPHIY